MKCTIFVAFLLFCFHDGLTCFFGENDTIHCTNITDISVQGTKQWWYLRIYNNYRRLHLRKNAFLRSFDLRKIELNDVDSIEEGSFNGLKHFEELRIYKSELEVISPGIFDNLPLKRIYIEGTKLKYVLPGVLDKLPQLELFSLQNNNIKDILNKVFTNIGLQKLYLNNNGIERIFPGAFENMTKFTELNLHENRLIEFNSTTYFGTSDSLTKLWLSNNSITNLNKDMFAPLPNLSELYLEMNQINAIGRETFINSMHLRYLDISNNKLREIPTNIYPLEGLNILEYLGLHNNRLTFISLATILGAANLKYISYGGNPFQCLCSKSLDSYVAQRNITRVCDDEYMFGGRPSCAFSNFNPKECLYDENFTIELDGLYRESLKHYPKLDLKCDLRNGPSKAVLNDNV